MLLSVIHPIPSACSDAPVRGKFAGTITNCVGVGSFVGSGDGSSVGSTVGSGDGSAVGVAVGEWCFGRGVRVGTTVDSVVAMGVAEAASAVAGVGLEAMAVDPAVGVGGSVGVITARTFASATGVFVSTQLPLPSINSPRIAACIECRIVRITHTILSHQMIQNR